MRTRQSHYALAQGWESLPSATMPPDLVLLFGSRALLQRSAALDELSRHVPRSVLFGCSTAGEIEGGTLHDEAVVATSIWFDKAHVRFAEGRLSDVESPRELGARLAQELRAPGLVHVLVLSDGTQVNGTALVAGLKSGLPPETTLSGGLSGDGFAMKETVVCSRGTVETGLVAAVGFYGPLHVGLGSVGGWVPFGPGRIITRSEGNVLFALDGEPALQLYRRYLGPHADALPASALLFPLQLMVPNHEPVVRTILGVDPAAGSMTFAGDVPVGTRVQLMRANFDQLIEAGETAAGFTRIEGHPPELALLVSCVGRRLVLKQRVEEELEAVLNVLGPGVTSTGFYSYGELAPTRSGAPCRLHNQTMTVTTFSES